MDSSFPLPPLIVESEPEPLVVADSAPLILDIKSGRLIVSVRRVDLPIGWLSLTVECDATGGTDTKMEPTDGIVQQTFTFNITDAHNDKLRVCFCNGNSLTPLARSMPMSLDLLEYCIPRRVIGDTGLGTVELQMELVPFY
jgi:hypothetical protein